MTEFTNLDSSFCFFQDVGTLMPLHSSHHVSGGTVWLAIGSLRNASGGVRLCKLNIDFLITASCRHIVHSCWKLCKTRRKGIQSSHMNVCDPSKDSSYSRYLYWCSSTMLVLPTIPFHILPTDCPSLCSFSVISCTTSDCNALHINTFVYTLQLPYCAPT